MGSGKLRIWKRACKSHSPRPPQDISCWRDGEHRSAGVIWANLFTSDCKSPQCIWALDPSEMSSSTYRHYPFTGFFFLSEIETLRILGEKMCLHNQMISHLVKFKLPFCKNNPKVYCLENSAITFKISLEYKLK